MKWFTVIMMTIFTAITAFADTRFHVRSFDAEKIVDEWSQKAQFGYGYESDMDISTFFIIEPEGTPKKGAKDTSASDNQKVLDSAKVETIQELYVELYGNYAAVKYLISYYQKGKNWKNYTFLVKKVEPGTKIVLQQLETYVKSSSRCASFANDKGMLDASRKRAVLCQRERLSMPDDF